MADILETSVLLRVRRILVSVLAALSLTGVLAVGLSPAWAQTVVPTAAATSTPIPVIHATLSGTVLPGVPASYCWPQAGQPPCALVDNPPVTTFSPVSAADQITFAVDPAAGQPTSLVATLPDDLDPANQPVQIDLQITKGIYTVNPALAAGKHRVIVQAAYAPDADGNQNYVEYAFGIQLGSASASTAAATFSAGGTASATAAVTMASTSVATAPATALPTKSVTAPVATTAVTVPATKAATPVATTPAVTAAVTASASSPTKPVATAIATTPAVTLAVTSAAPKTSTSVVTRPATKAATVPATTVPTATATVIVPTVTPFIITPVTPTAARTSTAAVSPSATPVLMNGLPALMITTNGQPYAPIAMTFLQTGADGTLKVITRPVNAPDQLATAVRGTTAQITFSGPSPTTELITITNADGTQTISQDLVAAGSDISYTLPTQAGLYNVYIALRWPADSVQNGQATYIFRINLTN